MKKHTVLLLGALLGISSFTAHAGPSLPNETEWAKGTNWKYLDSFAGFPHAWVYTPNSFSKKVPNKRAAVIYLMGCGQVIHQAAQSAGWPKAAEAFGMVVIIPEVIAPVYPNQADPNVACYNYGGGFPMATMPTRNSPDHKAIIAAGTKIVTDYPDLQVDPNQIYLSGLSAGGTVAMEVACMAPDIFSGLALAATPGMGSNQSQAIMPPTITADSIVKNCRKYTATSPNKQAAFKDQVVAIISDTNSLPIGNFTVVDGVITADKFINQKIWDGDKFCPYAYHAMNAQAVSTLLGVTKAETKVVLTSGKGKGCSGGEADRGDAYHECLPVDATVRDWQATADYWRDSSGRLRIVRIEQDTMRHRWPAGPVSSLDFPATPTAQTLYERGEINRDGTLNTAVLKRAPNGELGAIFTNNDTIDYPMFVANLFTENNPRINK